MQKQHFIHVPIDKCVMPFTSDTWEVLNDIKSLVVTLEILSCGVISAVFKVSQQIKWPEKSLCKNYWLPHYVQENWISVGK